MPSIEELLARFTSGLNDIAHAIRAKTGKDELLGIEEMAAEQDAVFDAGKNSVYESVVFTTDCTTTKQVADFLNQYVAPNDKLVIFISKQWNGIPASETPNNKGLWMMIMAEEFRPADNSTRYAPWCRWRDGTYTYNDFANPNYDFIVSAGEEWQKVVLL